MRAHQSTSCDISGLRLRAQSAASFFHLFVRQHFRSKADTESRQAESSVNRVPSALGEFCGIALSATVISNNRCSISTATTGL